MIYIDTNVFVYASIEKGVLGEKARMLIKSIQNGENPSITSAITLSEVVYAIRKEKGLEAALEGGKAVLEMDGLRIAELDRGVCFDTMEIMRETKLQPQDSIHYATMKHHGITAIITEDKEFNRIKDIKRYSISEFVRRHSKQN